MKTFDIKCEADQQEDGTYTLSVMVGSLDLKQAAEIAELLRVPINKIVTGVLSEGGKYETVNRDMRKPVQ